MHPGRAETDASVISRTDASVIFSRNLPAGIQTFPGRLKLTSASDGLTQRAADTEGRLRSLEKFRFQVVGALFVINALAVIIEQLIRRR